MGSWKLEKAYSTIDTRTWDADPYAVLAADDNWLTTRKPYLICICCEEKAVFVSKSRSNTPAHFRSKHADEGCDFATSSSKGADPNGVVAVPARFNDGALNREIVYAMPRLFHPPAFGPGSGPAGTEAGQPGVVHVLPEDGPRGRRATTSLYTQLAYLSNDADYPGEDVRLDVPGRGTAVLARDYFCRFENATADHARPVIGYQEQRSPLMAYWGVISDPRKDGKSLWLNPGESADRPMTVRVNYETFMNALGLDDHLKLKGCRLIVEGRLHQGRFVRAVEVLDLTRLAIRPGLPAVP